MFSVEKVVSAKKGITEMTVPGVKAAKVDSNHKSDKEREQV